MDRRRLTRRRGQQIQLRSLPGRYAISRVAADADVAWAAGEIVVVARARGEAMETTVICDESAVPDGVEHDAGWRAIRFVGTFGFGEVGVLTSVLSSLADSQVPVLTVGTFETDYVLVKSERFDRVRELLEEAGHAFVDDVA